MDAVQAVRVVFAVFVCGKRDVSCQPPKKYAERFKKFMEEHVIRDRD